MGGGTGGMSATGSGAGGGGGDGSSCGALRPEKGDNFCVYLLSYHKYIRFNQCYSTEVNLKHS